MQQLIMQVIIIQGEPSIEERNIGLWPQFKKTKFIRGKGGKQLVYTSNKSFHFE